MPLLAKPNSKLKKSGTMIYSFTLPAYQSSMTKFKTCPSARDCVADCYARRGHFMYPVVKQAHESNLAIARSRSFVELMTAEIKAMKKQPTHVRLHTAGDFFNSSYYAKWCIIAWRFPEITFYAYTKQVKTVKEGQLLGIQPRNFVTIFSYGGKEDHLILNHDRFAKVYASEDLIPENFANATSDDLIAIGENPRIGLAARKGKNPVNRNFIN